MKITNKITLILALTIIILNFFVTPIVFKGSPDSTGTGISFILIIIYLVNVTKNK